MTDGLSEEEKLYFSLKNIYRSYGYCQYRMRKFEEYSLYSENINFLKSKDVITFSDHGKLLALKPDVTLSIVKNYMPQKGSRKLYYRESVYRPDSNSRFTEISQIGLEYLGEIDGYACMEVLALAAESLKAAGGGFVIDISHMGVIDGIMAACGKTGCPAELAACIKSKNLHDLKSVCVKCGISEENAQKLCTLLGVKGGYMAQLTALKTLFNDSKCTAAADELEGLISGLENAGYNNIFNIDFSVINDAAYYNGVVFHGYLENFPRVVLSGGRYDNLVKKYYAAAGGIGFALYPDELSYYHKKTPGYDADILLLYGNKTPSEVLTKVKEYTLQGKSVRAAGTIPEGTFKEIINLQE